MTNQGRNLGRIFHLTIVTRKIIIYQKLIWHQNQISVSNMLKLIRGIFGEM